MLNPNIFEKGVQVDVVACVFFPLITGKKEAFTLHNDSVETNNNKNNPLVTSSVTKFFAISIVQDLTLLTWYQ